MSGAGTEGFRCGLPACLLDGMVLCGTMTSLHSSHELCRQPHENLALGFVMGATPEYSDMPPRKE